VPAALARALAARAGAVVAAGAVSLRPAVPLHPLPRALLLLGGEDGVHLLHGGLDVLVHLLHQRTRLLVELLHPLALLRGELRMVAALAVPALPLRALRTLAALALGAGTVRGGLEILRHQRLQLLVERRDARLQVAVDGLQPRHLLRREPQLLALLQDALDGAVAGAVSSRAAAAVHLAVRSVVLLRRRIGLRGGGGRSGRQRGGEQNG
jgi:hypothetical protein